MLPLKAATRAWLRVRRHFLRLGPNHASIAPNLAYPIRMVAVWMQQGLDHEAFITLPATVMAPDRQIKEVHGEIWPG